MTDGPPLTRDERRVLEAIMAVKPHDVRSRTTEAVAGRAGMATIKARRTLRGLERREPPLAVEDVDEGIGAKFWRTEYAAIEALKRSRS